MGQQANLVQNLNDAEVAPLPAAAPAAPLEVLQLLAALPVGGAEDLVAAMARGLDPAKFRVITAVLGGPGPVGHQLQAEGYPVISLGLDLKRTSFWQRVGAVRRLLRKERPDVLHTHLYHPNLYGRLAALGLGVPVVVASVHNSYTRVKLHRRLWNCLLGYTGDKVLVGSPQVWRDVHRFDWIPPGRLVLLPYGIGAEEMDTGLTREEARARLEVSGLVLGAVGRLEEQKGHRHLLSALPALRQEIGDLTLLLVGDGRLRAALQDQARHLGVAGMVRFLGTRRDLPEIFRALDIFVQPSLWEGLSLALLKAMGASLPVVATRVSGATEAIEDGINGCLVDPGDPDSLGRAIAGLTREPETRHSLGEAAKRRVGESYSLAAMLTRLATLYMDLYNRNRRA